MCKIILQILHFSFDLLDFLRLVKWCKAILLMSLEVFQTIVRDVFCLLGHFDVIRESFRHKNSPKPKE